ncbi:MAG: ATP phosphoribosyltransferase [Chloroflexi bacterium CG_4_8_14_3_um_filter_45_15]|nr:MAG: ATP phosphoribosyltransferase [Chloroflexi bacterium CG_4_8_14_3_um_filter_45_15]
MRDCFVADTPRNDIMKYQPIKFALPKGRFLTSTARLLNELDLGFADYNEKTRQYRLDSTRFPYLSAKVLQEKDIPVQVAIGNYDLGICGLDWIQELQTKYPASALVKVSSLDYGEGTIYVAASSETGISRLSELPRQGDYRIVSEYSNLAESLALNLRIRRFKIFPVWGAAEVYPPENADIAILWQKNESDLKAQGLVSLAELLPVTAYLIGNRKSLESKDLSQILERLSTRFVATLSSCPIYWAFPPDKSGNYYEQPLKSALKQVQGYWQIKEIKLALPDGHQQEPTSQFLEQTGLNFQGYSGEVKTRRPVSDLDWLGIKMIRPQDMPLQVANGNFDLAITGKDWLLEHLYRFPSSPVKELLDLGFGKVKIVVAISQDIPVNNIAELRALVQSGKLTPIRVASEYINVADKYLRDSHINPYKLIPTWGASEAFLPEDADLLIDNTQTGRTLAEHRLKIIEVLFQSTACLIGNKNSIDLPSKREKIELLVQKFQSHISPLP